MRLALFFALAAGAHAQTTLPLHPTPNNSGGVGFGVFLDVTAGPQPLTVTALRTASTLPAGGALQIEVLRRSGSALGGPASSGPGASLAGWTSTGVANGVQGSVDGGISQVLDIPDVYVPAGSTVGLGLRFVSGGPRYFGFGIGPPHTFQDAHLTVRTGDARSSPFTAQGQFFSPRGLCGELTYVLGAPSAVGTSYCGPAVPNSSGRSATILGLGSAVAQANDLRLYAAQLPAGSFGFFVTSRVAGLAPQPGGSQGVLCLGAGIGRYVAPGQVRSAGPGGLFDLPVNLGTTPTPSGPTAVVAGDTWHFQAWFRDAVAGTTTSNFTDGLRVTFL